MEAVICIIRNVQACPIRRCQRESEPVMLAVDK
jgi:hypothetical protein